MEFVIIDVNTGDDLAMESEPSTGTDLESQRDRDRDRDTSEALSEPVVEDSSGSDEDDETENEVHERSFFTVLSADYANGYCVAAIVSGWTQAQEFEGAQACPIEPCCSVF